MPSVSVIIPNYNHARYLDQRIRSVLDQRFQDFEVLLLDDASPDSSRQVIEAYRGDPRIRIHYNETNSGSSFKQWNKGFRLAAGDYLWIAESDDFADPSFLGTMVARLSANPKAVLAYCQSMIVDSEGRAIQSMKDFSDLHHPSHWAADFSADGREEVCRHFLEWNPIPNASAALIRRETVLKVGLAREEFRLTADWLLWASLLEHGDVEFVSQPLNYYRTHAGTVRSASQRSGRDLEEIYRAVGWIAKRFPVGAAQVTAVRESFFRRWCERMGDKECAVPFGQHRRIHTAARGLDPWVEVRLIRALAGFILRKLGLRR